MNAEQSTAEVNVEVTERPKYGTVGLSYIPKAILDYFAGLGVVVGYRNRDDTKQGEDSLQGWEPLLRKKFRGKAILPHLEAAFPKHDSVHFLKGDWIVSTQSFESRQDVADYVKSRREQFEDPMPQIESLRDILKPMFRATGHSSGEDLIREIKATNIRDHIAGGPDAAEHGIVSETVQEMVAEHRAKKEGQT